MPIGKREIGFLCVKCHNVERNCTWEGTVGTVEEHVVTCQFTLLPCPKECKDDSNETNHFMKKDLQDHLKEDCPNRDYTCQYCGEEGIYATITQVHDKICQNKILPCTNTGCPETMQRQHIAQHVRSECEHTVIACKHKSTGCETELKRRDMAAHELDEKLHFHMAINTITQLKDIITQLKDNSDIVLKQGEPMNIRFVDYQERKESKKQFTSPFFYTSHGYHMALKVSANGYGDGEGTHVSVYVAVVKGKCDLHLSWPLLGSVTVTLLNQLDDKSHRIMIVFPTSKQDTRVGSNWGYHMISHSALGYYLAKKTQYLKDNTLYFRVLVEVEDNKPWLQSTVNM